MTATCCTTMSSTPKSISLDESATLSNGPPANVSTPSGNTPSGAGVPSADVEPTGIAPLNADKKIVHAPPKPLSSSKLKLIDESGAENAMRSVCGAGSSSPRACPIRP